MTDVQVQRAVQLAKPAQPRKLVPILRMLYLHIVLVPTSLAYLPYVLLRALVPFLRPARGWTARQTLSVMYTRLAMELFVITRFQPIAPREHGWRETPGLVGALLSMLNYTGPGGRVAHPRTALKAAMLPQHDEKKRGDRVWFGAPPLEYFRGILSVNPTGKDGQGGTVKDCDNYHGAPLVRPGEAKTRTRAFWFMPGGPKEHAPLPQREKGQNRQVILYFHGGAGVTFSAGDMFMGLTLAQNLARTSGFPVFSVDYHLAPYGRFPVALIQCLAGYVHLTRDLGFRGDQIIVGGDSNGAHLTLLLERFLRLEGSKIPSHAAQRQRGEPDFAAVLLLSPWVVATNDMMPQREENLKYDIVPRKYGDWGVEAMQFVNPSRKTGMKLDDPWISPLMRTVEEVAQMPPTYVANGQLEVLYEEGKRFAAKCKQAGLITRHHVTPLEPHDFFCLAASIPNAKKVYADFAHWVTHDVLAKAGYKL